nr:MAG TPA: hypothetical protein [Caudoviricetes sp.]
MAIMPLSWDASPLAITTTVNRRGHPGSGSIPPCS